MKKEKYILDEAIDSLFRYTNVETIVKNGGLKHDAFLMIANGRAKKSESMFLFTWES